MPSPLDILPTLTAEDLAKIRSLPWGGHLREPDFFVIVNGCGPTGKVVTGVATTELLEGKIASPRFENHGMLEARVIADYANAAALDTITFDVKINTSLWLISDPEPNPIVYGTVAGMTFPTPAITQSATQGYVEFILRWYACDHQIQRFSSELITKSGAAATITSTRLFGNTAEDFRRTAGDRRFRIDVSAANAGTVLTVRQCTVAHWGPRHEGLGR